MQLGDAVERALAAVGITQTRVQKWLGVCGCEERKQKLNRLGRWARSKLRSKYHVEALLNEDCDTSSS